MSTEQIITPQAIDRLEGQAIAQRESAARQIALTPYEWGAPINPSGGYNPTAQDLHPSAQRLDAGAWDGKTSLVNHAQAAQPDSEVWVTVPVDKVVTGASSPRSAAAVPVYASTRGYVPRPGESAGSIPPTVPTTRPY